MNKRDREDPRGAMSPAVGAAFDRAFAAMPAKAAAPKVVAKATRNQLDAFGEKVSGLEGPKAIALAAFTLEALARPHASGWPEVREDEFAEMAGGRPGERAKATSALLAAGLAELRVSGRKKPTVCVRLSWLPEPEGNPVFEAEIGPNAPETLIDAVNAQGGGTICS